VLDQFNSLLIPGVFLHTVLHFYLKSYNLEAGILMYIDETVDPRSMLLEDLSELPPGGGILALCDNVGRDR
jgi:hypothetical protein